MLKYLIYGGLIMAFFHISAQESQSAESKISTQSSLQQAPLTKEKVRHYIKTNVVEFKLQQKIKSQEALYENVIKEFYAQRKVMLEENGWNVEAYEATEKRIFAAKNAIELNATMKSEAEFNKEIAEVNDNSYLTEEQKKQTIQLLKQDRENRITMFVNPSKADWPAVKDYLKELTHLTDYYAGNRPDAPVLK